MTDIDIIQQARAMLAKWRERASTGAWTQNHVAELLGQRDGRLIVGTAGNPDLLDAIDALLIWSKVSPENDNIRVAAQNIAVAIIAADERMSA